MAVHNSVLCLDFSVLSSHPMHREGSDEPSRRAHGRAMGIDRAAIATDQAQGWPWQTAYQGSSGTERHLLDSAYRCCLGGSPQAFPLTPDLPPALPGVGGIGRAKGSAGSTS